MLDWLPTVVMLAVVVGVDLVIHQRRARPDEQESAEGLLRPAGDRRLRLYVLFALLVAWWVIPGGWLLLGLVVFAGSWISPAGRAAWVDERLPRWGMVGSVLVGLLLVG
ncbi:MAG: hypothetical protein VXZ95_03685, partial [Candidatus Thermoplasmatota archaeon]|nr:hypothetical protein [Candidatus Thermoplasmatota archaeon]